MIPTNPRLLVYVLYMSGFCWNFVFYFQTNVFSVLEDKHLSWSYRANPNPSQYWMVLVLYWRKSVRSKKRSLVPWRIKADRGFLSFSFLQPTFLYTYRPLFSIKASSSLDVLMKLAAANLHMNMCIKNRNSKLEYMIPVFSEKAGKKV